MPARAKEGGGAISPHANTPTVGRGGPVAVLIFAAAAALWAPAPAGAQSVAEQLDRARNCAEEDRLFKEGLPLTERIVADRQATPQQKAEAYELMLRMLTRQRKRREIATAAQQMLAALPGNAKAAAVAHIAWAQTLWDKGRSGRDEAVAKLDEYLAKYGSDRSAATVQASLARFLLDTGKNDRSLAEAAKAWQAGPDDQVAIEALRCGQEAALRSKDHAAGVDALGRLLDDRYAKVVSVDERREYYRRYGQCLRELKRYDAARDAYRKAEKADERPEQAGEFAVLVGATCAEEKKYDEAVKACERVFVDYADESGPWYNAQVGIVEALRGKGDYARALQAARIRLDAAGEEWLLRQAVEQVAELLKAVDHNVARANAFLDFQKHGPAGADGKPGTADDLSDPLAKVGYPSYPDRQKALAKARAEAGDDAYGARHRARSHIYAGQPREALRFYLDAFARCRADEVDRYARELVLVGVRALRGHAVGLEEFFQFISYGPAGADGKAGTADDLKDPFASLGVALSKPGPKEPGGPAQLTAEDIQALRDVRPLLKRLAFTPLESTQTRRDAVRSLLRVEQALNEWPPAELDWCVDSLGKTRDTALMLELLSAAETAARAGARHLGGVREFWAKVLALEALQGRQPARTVEQAHKRSMNVAAQVRLTRMIAPRDLTPMKINPVKLDLSNLPALREESK